MHRLPLCPGEVDSPRGKLLTGRVTSQVETLEARNVNDCIHSSVTADCQAIGFWNEWFFRSAVTPILSGLAEIRTWQ